MTHSSYVSDSDFKSALEKLEHSFLVTYCLVWNVLHEA